jgi:hypothetical protein
MREGLASETSGADVHDALESGIRGWWTFDSGWRFGLAAADLPSPWGEGGQSAEAQSRSMGPGFGYSNGIHRKSAGFSAHTKDARLGGFDLGAIDFGVMNSWGSRTVSQAGANPGHYQLDVLTLTASTTRLF